MRTRIQSLTMLLSVALLGATPATAPPRVTTIELPGAPPEGLTLDYLAVDRARHQVWVPAAGSGRVDVIDTETGALHAITDFPVSEVERNGRKRKVGPSSASVGDGVVYVGDRADSSVCAIDIATLARAGCVTLPSMPDGVAYVASAKEVWVTTPRDQSLTVLDVSDARTPKVAGRISLPGDPEGYAVDDEHHLFYTNLEDQDRTLRLSITTRKVTATWKPDCGTEGPRGLALAADGRVLVVACTDRIETLLTGEEGKVAAKLPTGDGLDNLDYLPARHLIYAAAAGAATLTTARLDDQGRLTKEDSVATAKGARNAVATEAGVAYIASGPDGKVVVVRPAPRG